MALTKISTGMLKQDAASSDLNIDAGTLYLDVSNNRVGVANTSPSQALDVTGAIQTDTSFRAYDSVNTAYRNVLRYDGGNVRLETGTGSSASGIGMWTAGSERIRIDSSGNVLVGTTGHFNYSGGTTEITVGTTATGATAGGAVTFVSNNGATTLGYVGFQESEAQIGTMGSRPLVFTTNNTDRMRIDSSGRVGVGVTPKSWLTTVNVIDVGTSAAAYYSGGVTHNAYFDNTNNRWQYKGAAPATFYNIQGGTHIWSYAASGTADSPITFSEAMRIHSNGQVGIGVQNPTEALDVNNSIAVGLNIKGTGANTTLYNPSGDMFIRGGTSSNLNFGANNTNSLMILTSAGNLGIGTTPSSEKLEVAGNILIDTSGNPSMTVKTTGAGNNPFVRIQADTNYWDLQTIFSNTDDELDFRYNGVSKLIINKDGEVGIGTTSPSKKLHVQDSSAHQLQLQGNNSFWNIGTGWSGYYQDYLLFATSTGEKMVIDTNGNVGIGTNSPGVKLHISSSANTTAKITAGTNGSASLRLVNDAHEWDVNCQTTDTFAIYSHTDGVARLVILPTSGNVGIGTTSPQAKLHIEGDGTYASIRGYSQVLDLGNWTNGEVRIESTGAPFHLRAAGNQPLHLETDNVERVTVLGTGNVGIGTTSPDYKLEVVGDSLIGDATAVTSPVFGAQQQIVKSFTHGQYGIGRSGNLYLLNTNTSGEAGFLCFGGYSNHTNNLYYQTGGIGGGTEAQDGGSWGGYLNFWTTSDGTAGAASGQFEHMRITADGNVGIGTSSPEQKLHVDGTVKIGDTLILREDGTNDLVQSTGNVLYLKAPEFNFQDNSGNQQFYTTSSRNFIVQNNLGIGTSNPLTALHVGTTGGNAYSSTITKSSNMKGGIFTQASNGDDMVGVYFATGSTTEGTHWSGITGSRSNNAAHWGTQLNFYTHDNDVANLNDATQKMVITGDGNVGIGTTSPTYKMEVDGGSAETRLRISTTGTDADEAGIILANSSKTAFNDGIQIAHGAAITSFRGLTGTLHMAIDGTNSRVGIGTSSPQEKFEINGNLRMFSSGYPLIDIGITTSNYFRFLHDNPNDIFKIGKNGAATLNIGGSGNVGIGTASPQAKLEVQVAAAGAASNIVAAGTGAGIYLEDSNSPTKPYFVSKIHNPGNNTAIGGIKFAVSPDAANYSWSGIKAFTSTSGTAGPLGFFVAGGNTTADASTEKVRINISSSTANFAVGVLGVAGLNATAAIHGGSADAGLVISNDNLADSTAAYGWTGRGGRYLTSNGTNWTADGKDPGLVIGSADGSTQRRNLGIVLHNEDQGDNAFSPGLFFGNRSNSGSYNTSYGYIMGRKKSTGVDSNWSVGEIHMDTAGVRTGTISRTAYMDNIPAVKIDANGDVDMPYKAFAYGTITGSSISNITNNYGIALTTTRYQNCTPQTSASHGPGVTITKAGFYLLSMLALYDPNNNAYAYLGWCVNGSQIHHWHSNHAVASNHDAVSSLGVYLNIGDHVTFENSSQTVDTIYGQAHSAWYICKIG